jgi:hypothetical protein
MILAVAIQFEGVLEANDESFVVVVDIVLWVSSIIDDELDGVLEEGIGTFEEEEEGN